MKKLLIIFILLKVHSVSFSQVKQSIPFVWSNDTLSNEFFEKTSMHIPVIFDNDTTTYYFQFDTGSNSSFIYTGCENLGNKLLNKETIDELFQTNIGELKLKLKKSNAVEIKNGRTNIGTIGADFLAGKIVEIDFKNNVINLLEDGYGKESYSLSTLVLSFGRPKIPLVINDKEYIFLYDTGSSLFEIWTTKRLWKKWKKPNSKVSRFPISSWGKINFSYRTEIYKIIYPFNDSSILIKEIWYNSNRKFGWGFKKGDIHGIIGNKPFLDKTILIDMVNRKIGIKKST